MLANSEDVSWYNYTVEPPIKETPNKGNFSIMNRITFPKTSLSYSANTLITSQERNLSIMNRITFPKTSRFYSANTFITSEERSIMNRITCPKSYVVQRFHCIHDTPVYNTVYICSVYQCTYMTIVYSGATWTWNHVSMFLCSVQRFRFTKVHATFSQSKWYTHIYSRPANTLSTCALSNTSGAGNDSPIQYTAVFTVAALSNST